MTNLFDVMDQAAVKVAHELQLKEFNTRAIRFLMGNTDIVKDLITLRVAGKANFPKGSSHGPMSVGCFHG